jgi:hypothetical protein
MMLDLAGLSPAVGEDLSSTASSYSSFAGILAGFSFAALAIYLGWRPEVTQAGPAPVPGAGARADEVQGTAVATGLFYAMASLVMCSFLYASLTVPMSDQAQRIPTELLVYGVVFGLSVLVLFYALTLMMYERSHTRQAARYAYWVVVLAGPLVVLRFLMDVANSVWDVQCAPDCSPSFWTPPVQAGVIFLVVLLVLTVVVTVLRMLDWWDYTHRKLKWLYEHPMFPTVVVFAVTTGVTILSLVITVPVSFVSSRPVALWMLCIAFVFLTLFALACGCVIGPRVEIGLPPSAGKALQAVGLRRLWIYAERRARSRFAETGRPAGPSG